jgi:hypothetical protein
LPLGNIYNQQFLILENFTATSYASSVYLDFGLVEISVFDAVIALFGFFLYRRIAIREEKLAWMLIYAVYIHNVVLLPFINMFFSSPTMVQLVLIPLIWREQRLKLQGMQVRRRCLYASHNREEHMYKTYSRLPV